MSEAATQAEVLRQVTLHQTEVAGVAAVELKTDAGSRFYALDAAALAQLAQMLAQYATNLQGALTSGEGAHGGN